MKNVSKFFRLNLLFGQALGSRNEDGNQKFFWLPSTVKSLGRVLFQSISQHARHASRCRVPQCHRTGKRANRLRLRLSTAWPIDSNHGHKPAGLDDTNAPGAFSGSFQLRICSHVCLHFFSIDFEKRRPYRLKFEHLRQQRTCEFQHW